MADGFEYIIDFEELTPDFSPTAVNQAMRDIAEFAARDVKRNIRQQQEFDGVAFKPLAPSTIKSKKTYKNVALRRTSQMYNSIVAQKLRPGTYIVVAGGTRDDYSNSGINFNADLSDIHNTLGAGVTRVTRQFLGISERVEKYMSERIDRFIASQLEKAPKRKRRIQ